MNLPNPGETEFAYYLIVGDTNSKITPYRYSVIGMGAYKTQKNVAIIGLIKVNFKTKEQGEIEQTPLINNKYSRYIAPPILRYDQKIWRYVDLFKFEDLVNSSTLYLSRIDQFEDKLEGISPESCMQAILEDTRFNKSQIDEWLKRFEERILSNRISSFVCCWHMNDKISESMWNAYCKYPEESIAIETNIGKLIRVTRNSPFPVLFEAIRYFEEPFFNQESYWFPTLFKRKGFEPEQEYRSAVYIPYGNNSTSFRINIKVEELISKIYLHPKASTSHRDKIRSMLKEKKLQIKIIDKTTF